MGDPTSIHLRCEVGRDILLIVAIASRHDLRGIGQVEQICSRVQQRVVEGPVPIRIKGDRNACCDPNSVLNVEALPDP